jgi:DNA-binding transcriptional LysR family regulator
MNISLRDISYFLAVAGTARLSQAAELCGVTQPALSKAMLRLEGELGLKLLERHARGTRMTAAGQQFLPMAQNLHAGDLDAQRLAGELRARGAGLLRIGVTNATRTGLLAPVLGELIQQRAGLRVQLRIGRSDQLAKSVQAGELDLALVPAYSDTTFSCEHTVIGLDPLLPVVRADHPLARLTHPKLKDLQPFSWLLASSTSTPHRLLNALYRSRGLPAPTVVVETDFASEIDLTLLRSTNLLALVPQSMMSLNEQSDLHVLPLSELKLEREVVMLNRTGVATPLMRTLQERVSKHAMQMDKSRAKR